MDIKERLARISFFDIKPDFSSLNNEQRESVSYCIDASNMITDIYLDQVHPRNRGIYEELKRRTDDEGRDLLRYFMIQGSPWDEFNNNEPFISGAGKRPEFGYFYPENFTKEEWKEWLRLHPEDTENFESPYTVIKRTEDGLISVPYSERYKWRLQEVSGYLEKAASHLPPGNLKTFLQLRADAFRRNNYFESDMAWVDTNGNPFEVTIGPYEVYFDGLLGLKSAFESFIALPDRDSTKALARFNPKVPDFDAMLSQEFNFSPKGSAIPLEVVADVIRGGESGFGSMFSAYCLPNDRRIHDLKGSKKVFSRTMMEAKFSTMSLPIAERILPSNLLDRYTFDNRLLFVLGHELAHGLGPSKVKVDGREIPFETALGDLHSSIEEAKADMLGSRLLSYLGNQGLIDDKTLEGILSTEVVSFFQGWNKGFKEAHARGNLIEYNWLKESNALHYNPITKKYDIDFERCIDAMSRLSTEFLNLQVAGNYEHTKAFMEKWGFVPEELPKIVESISDIPTAVSPVWDLSGLKNSR